MVMKSSGTIVPHAGLSKRVPYEHQKEAMRALDLLNRESSFSTMIVLPTGGGKTYTAVNWLLRHAVDKGSKVLWIAHRHMLLNQAAQAFADNAFSSAMPNVGSFTYRIVSGHKDHAKASSISLQDDVIIASKDSLRSQLERVNRWLSGQTDAFLVVDEAHHATAKTYRQLIELLVNSVPHLKVIGLTATPFRTLESERGLLSKIFKDGVVDGRVVRDDVGIAYQIGLQDLINRFILARPYIDACQTEEHFGDSLGARDIDLMRRFDRIPDKVAMQMVASRERNRLIVETYVKNREKYGKTILFAVNIKHAVTLQELFSAAGVKSDYVVSTLKDDDTGKSRTQAENDAVLERYSSGDLEVVINVNILTEGVDLPKTQSVFLTRPTSSTIMMTQMVGRALRGTKAGGTDKCYIVTFMDGWDERVAWVNPSTLYSGDTTFAEEDPHERERAEIQTISISMIREFAQILDSTVDTKYLEAIPFVERIPLGMYVFSYTEQGEEGNEGADVSCQVMVYSSTQAAYERFVGNLSVLTSGCVPEDEEFASDLLVRELTSTAERQYFSKDLVPPYRRGDIASIIRYYIQFGTAPTFYPFDQIDRNRLDVGAIARTIVDKDMGSRAAAAYENKLWDEGDENVLRMLFTNKYNFFRAVDNEKRKLTNPEEFEAYLPSGYASYDVDPIDDEPEIASDQIPADIVKASSGSTPELPNSSTGEASDSRTSAALQVVSGGRINERISRTAEQLHPAEERLASMREYHAAGLAVFERTGMPILRFGGKARESVDEGRLALYSLGFRVAELDPEGRVHLLIYSLDGVRQGWDKSKQSLHHAGDFAAFHLGLDKAPSKLQFEEMAQQADSRVLIAHVDVASKALPEDGQGGAAEGKARAVKGVGGFGAGSHDSGLTTSNASVRNERPDGSRGAAHGSGSTSVGGGEPREKVADPPSQIFDKDFERLQNLIPSGKVNRVANTPYTSFGGRAKLLERGDFVYLYVKRSNKPALRVARWSKADGLVLYEYDGMRGWSDAVTSSMSRDFATQMLGSDRALSTMDLRKASDSVDKPVKTMHCGRPSIGTFNSDSSAKKKIIVSPALGRGASHGGLQRNHQTLEDRSMTVYKEDRAIKLKTSEVSCIKSASPRSCTVFTASGDRYQLPSSLSETVDRFTSLGFVKVNVGCLVRPAMIESIAGSTTKEAEVKGVPMPVYVTDKAYRQLVNRFWSSGRNA